MSNNPADAPVQPCPRCQANADEGGWCGVCGADLFPDAKHPRFSRKAAEAAEIWERDPDEARRAYEARHAPPSAVPATTAANDSDKHTALQRFVIAAERAAVLDALAREARELAERMRTDAEAAGLTANDLDAALRDAPVPMTVEHAGKPSRASSAGGLLFFYQERGPDLDGDGDVDGGLIDQLDGGEGGMLDGLMGLFE